MTREELREAAIASAYDVYHGVSMEGAPFPLEEWADAVLRVALGAAALKCRLLWEKHDDWLEGSDGEEFLRHEAACSALHDAVSAIAALIPEGGE